jgi:hypothetical protein
MSNTESESLVQLFGGKRVLLRQQLAEKPAVDLAPAILRNFILALFAEYGQHSQDERRIAIVQSLAGCVAEASQLLLGASKSTVWETQAYTGADMLPQETVKNPGQWLLPLIRIVVTAGLSLWLYLSFSGTLEHVVTIAAFVVVLATQIVELVLSYLQGRKRRSQRDEATRAPQKTQRIVIEVDPDTVILKLRDLLLQADRTIDQISYAQSQMHDPSDVILPDTLLDYMHELAAAQVLEDKEYAALLSKKVAALLLPFGITMLTAFNGANQSKFDVEPNLETGQTRVMLSKPAFIKNGEVIRRGVVLVPQSIR